MVWMTDTSEQAAKDRAQAQLTKAMADMVTQVSFAAVNSSVKVLAAGMLYAVTLGQLPRIAKQHVLQDHSAILHGTDSVYACMPESVTDAVVQYNLLIKQLSFRIFVQVLLQVCFLLISTTVSVKNCSCTQ